MLGDTALTSDGQEVPMARCKACLAPIYWGVTRKGKRCPFDVYTLDSGDVVASGISHFRTCSRVREFEHSRTTTREAVSA